MAGNCCCVVEKTTALVECLRDAGRVWFSAFFSQPRDVTRNPFPAATFYGMNLVDKSESAMIDLSAPVDREFTKALPKIEVQSPVLNTDLHPQAHSS